MNYISLSEYSLFIINNPLEFDQKDWCEICKISFSNINDIFYFLYGTRYNIICAQKIHMNNICFYSNFQFGPRMHSLIDIISSSNLANKDIDDYKDYLKTKLKKSLLLL